MEVRHEPPLVKLFAGIGFFWVGILFTMTLVDYLSRRVVCSGSETTMKAHLSSDHRFAK